MKKSSRSLKNIIMVIVLILMLGASVFTIYFARKNISNNVDANMNSEIQDNRMEQQPSGVPNDPPNGNQSQQAPANDNNGNVDKSKTDEKSTNEKTTESAMEQRTDNNINNSIPRGNNRRMPQQGRKDFNNTDFRKDKISSVYSMLFGIESLISALIIMYLIMSKFNKNTFKETLENTDKIIIFIFGTIILTTIFTRVFSIISII